MSFQKSESKKKVDPFLLFSIGKKNNGENFKNGKILVADSDDESEKENEPIAKKLSFSSSADGSKLSIGEDLSHQIADEKSGFLQQSECEEEEDNLSLLNENEQGNKLSQKGM